MAIHLHAFDLATGRFLDRNIDSCADVRSGLADKLAKVYGVDVDRIAFDCREDEVEYVTVDGRERAYVLNVAWDGSWRGEVPFGVPDTAPIYRDHHNDNVDTFTPAMQRVRAVLAGAE